VKNDHATACKTAKEILDKSESSLPADEDDENYRDAISIINLLRENLEMWKIEAEEANN
jgi:hypothetical protein